MRRKSKNAALRAALVIGLGLVMILGIIGSNIVPNISNGPAAVSTASNDPVPCGDAQKKVPEEYKIYSHLSILVDGSSVTIPSGIGLAPGCDRVIYTKDNSGTIRVEPNVPRAYTLGNFFSVWSQPFSASQVGGFKADASHAITMSVNGNPSTDFGNLVLQDKQEIVLNYQTVAPAPHATSGTSSSSPFTVTVP